jgi:signal transduction histidine kinase
MRPRSLVSRLALLQQVSAVTIVATFATSALWLTSRVLQRDETRMLQVAAQRMAENLDHEISEGRSLPAAAGEALAEEPPSELRWEIYNADGQLLAAAPRFGSPTPSPGTAPPVAGLRTAAQRGPLARLHAEAAGASCGARVVASVSTAERAATLLTLTRILAAAALPLLIATLLLGRRLAAGALRPLADMTQRAAILPGAHDPRRLGDPIGLDEIDQLTEAFNRLLSRLDELLQSERRFAADASHELRTPLTVLAGEIEAALAHKDLPAPVRDNLRRASQQTLQMRELVEALLLLRRTGGGVPGQEAGFEPVNLSDVAREARSALIDRHPARAGDITLAAPDEVMIAGNPALLASAIGNLLDNAIKFTMPGQALGMRVDVEGAHAVLVVDDAGAGVRPEERERIFDPFYRGGYARSATGGFGLGMPIVRQVARAHGGDVTAGVSPLGGARFTLSMPPWPGTVPSAVPVGAIPTEAIPTEAIRTNP